MARSKDENLNNPESEPARSPLDVVCTVHFRYYETVPKVKLQEWLASLPDAAKLKFKGIASGEAYFEASWTEAR